MSNVEFDQLASELREHKSILNVLREENKTLQGRVHESNLQSDMWHQKALEYERQSQAVREAFQQREQTLQNSNTQMTNQLRQMQEVIEGMNLCHLAGSHSLTVVLSP